MFAARHFGPAGEAAVPVVRAPTEMVRVGGAGPGNPARPEPPEDGFPIVRWTSRRRRTGPIIRDPTGMCGAQITLANSVHRLVTAQLQLNQRIN